MKENQIMKNNIVIRLEEKSEYRKVENLVRDSFWNVYRPGCLEHYALNKILIFVERVDSGRQASMVSVIMDCQRGKMHHSFCVKSLYLVILMRLLVSMQHRKAILWMSRTQKNLISSFHKHLSMPAFVHLKQVLHILKAHLLPRY